jgi:hypothetical protein
MVRQFQQGGRGGPPPWQGLANARAFGSGRRNQRPLYNGQASFNLDDSVWDARNLLGHRGASR